MTHTRHLNRASTLRQAKGDTACHGELVEPWIPAQQIAGMTTLNIHVNLFNAFVLDC
jgi:hypothetical protein